MPERYKSVLLFGAPGVGKGTQGQILGCIPGTRHLSTGDMFRGLDRTTDLGQRIAAIMSRGELVPDELTIQLWQDHVANRIANGQYNPSTDLLILDGVPRSRDQAKAIDPYVEVLLIIHLGCRDMNEMIRRMKKRAAEQNRPDDADENVIRRRFCEYEEKTRPVLSHYDRQLVREVNCLGTPVQVLNNVLDVLVPVYNAHCSNPLSA